MKNQNKIELLLDSVIAIAQAILFAIVPIVFNEEYSQQLMAYGGIVVLQMIYIFLLRKLIVNKIVFPHGVEISHIVNKTYNYNFHQRVLPQIIEMLPSNSNLQFEEYCIFLKWMDSTGVILDSFWDTAKKSVVNVELTKTTEYSKKFVYKNELLQAVNILINIYKTNNSFTDTISLFECSTQKNSLEESFSKLQSMKTYLEKSYT